MRRNPTWIFALVIVVAMLAGAWYVLRPRETLTIIVLLQRKYEDFPVAASIDDGIQLALEEVGHRAGRYRLAVKKMDTRPEFDVYVGVEEGAKEALANPGVVAVIGPSRYHSSTIAADLNRAGILMLAPDERMPELTKPGYGYSNTTPECYRPSGELNFFRVIPDDEVAERGTAEWAWKNGARTALAAAMSDYELREDSFARTARRLGMTCGVADSPYVTSLDDSVLASNPDVLYYRGHSLHFLNDILSETRCLGWDGRILVRGDDLEPELKAGNEVPDGVIALQRTGPPAEFARKFTARFNRPADRAAWYGYRAASTVVESIDRANTKDRNEIRRVCAQLPMFDRHGDTLSNGLDVWTVREGRAVVTETFTPAPRPPDLPKPLLTLSFHGTLDAHVDAAYHAMVHRDMRGTFYIDSAKVDTSDGAASEDLEKLRRYGHEIVVGAPPIGVEGPGRTLEEVRAIVDRALADRKHVELLFQKIGEGDPAPDRISREDFRELCEYIHSKGFVVVPARELRR